MAGYNTPQGIFQTPKQTIFRTKERQPAAFGNRSTKKTLPHANTPPELQSPCVPPFASWHSKPPSCNEHLDLEGRIQQRPSLLPHFRGPPTGYVQYPDARSVWSSSDYHYYSIALALVSQSRPRDASALTAAVAGGRGYSSRRRRGSCNGSHGSSRRFY